MGRRMDDDTDGYWVALLILGCITGCGLIGVVAFVQWMLR